MYFMTFKPRNLLSLYVFILPVVGLHYKKNRHWFMHKKHFIILNSTNSTSISISEFSHLVKNRHDACLLFAGAVVDLWLKSIESRRYRYISKVSSFSESIANYISSAAGCVNSLLERGDFIFHPFSANFLKTWSIELRCNG